MGVKDLSLWIPSLGGLASSLHARITPARFE